jgi:hypothetical protein
LTQIKALRRCFLQGFGGDPMEDTMSKPGELGPTLKGTVDHLLARWREWWRRGDELSQFDRAELERIAGDLGMTAHDLEDLTARGPRAADLLYERMQAIGIGRVDVERIAFGLMRDLEKTCARCEQKKVCENDLTERPSDPAWKEYCPNAVSLESVKRTKGHFV